MPIPLVLVLCVVGVALAAWLGIATSSENILGAKGEVLEISADNVTWAGDLPGLLSNGARSD